MEVDPSKTFNIYDKQQWTANVITEKIVSFREFHSLYVCLNNNIERKKINGSSRI